MTSDNQGIYHALDGFPDTLRIIDNDAENEHFYLVNRSDMSELTFNKGSNSTAPIGALTKVATVDGRVSEYVYENGKLKKVKAFGPDSGSDPIAELEYTYAPGGNFAQIVLSEVDNGILAPVKRVSYAYYDRDICDECEGTGECGDCNNPIYGNLGDLKTVHAERHDGSQWVTDQTYYYRYYLPKQENGVKHLLKMAFFPAEFADLEAEFGNPDCFDATDEQVLNFSTKYYEYDYKNRVCLERVDRNRQTIGFKFQQFLERDDHNAAHCMTTETMPQENKNIVITNFKGNVILREETSPPDSDEPSSIHHFVYDDSGKLTHYYTPKAVLGYEFAHDEGKTTLEVAHSTGEGMIKITEYGEEENAACLDVPTSHVWREWIQRGTAGTRILQKQYRYEKREIDAKVAWDIVEVIQFEDENGQSPISTQYVYAFHTNLLQVAQKTTILPAVPVAQNGNGQSASRTERFDKNGRLICTVNELGVIDYREFDEVTGLMTKSIQDLDTSKTSDFTLSAVGSFRTVSWAGKHLITEYEYDYQRRLVQTLGPKNTGVNESNQAIDYRPASWTTYNDSNHTTTNASGYAKLNSVGEIVSFTLGNPVSVTVADSAGRITDQIQAARSNPNGKLSPSDTFPQSTWTAWAKNIYSGSDLIAIRAYFEIPASGEGVKDTHYNETQYFYDEFGRKYRTITPDGTIHENVIDWHDDAVATRVGTNDSNMVTVTETIHGGEGGCPTCSGTTRKPRLSIQHVDDVNTRVTEYGYDWRGRQVHTHYEADAEGNVTYDTQTYDNLGRVVKSERFLEQQNSDDRLLAKTEQFHDKRGQIWKSEQSVVNPATGTVQGKLLAQSWFDAKGQTVKSFVLGENKYTENEYDSLGHMSKVYLKVGDIIFEQNEVEYDNLGNVIMSTSFARNHDAVGTGSLTTSIARPQYSASWFDPMGRAIASANYGTNDNVAVVRGDTVPVRSDLVLISEVKYDTNTGQAFRSIDPAGRESRAFFDALGRTVKTVTNWIGSGTVSASTPDQNVTVEMTYHPSGQTATLTAANPTTGNQVTRYVYGTAKTSATPLVYRNDLLVAEMYPDSDDFENSQNILQNGLDNIATGPNSRTIELANG